MSDVEITPEQRAELHRIEPAQRIERLQGEWSDIQTRGMRRAGINGKYSGQVVVILEGDEAATLQALNEALAERATLDEAEREERVRAHREADLAALRASYEQAERERKTRRRERV